MARILVVGKYVTPSVYKLYKPDGTLFKVIREGEVFRVGNLTYRPVLEPKKSGNGTIMVCRRLSKDQKRVLGETVLLHYKKGLWALDAPSALYNLFTWYHEPENELEKILDELCAPREIVEKVEKINYQPEIGGKKTTQVYDVITDCPKYVPDKELHPHKVSIQGGTYVIYYHYDLYNRRRPRPVKILLTDSANEEVVLSILKNM